MRMTKDLVPGTFGMQSAHICDGHSTSGLMTISDEVNNESSTTMSSSTRSSILEEYKKSTTVGTLQRYKLENSGSRMDVQNKGYKIQQNEGQLLLQSQKVGTTVKFGPDMFDHIQQETKKNSTRSTSKIQKQTKKNTAPRFISPITGMIVDQGSEVILEGIVDGFPLPNIHWTKNGQKLRDGIKMTFEHNHVRLELKTVNVKDAGRYTCTAENKIGNASSTADLVIKKTIFPPVFGKRLQAQVVEKDERAIMEVEVTGMPDPIVTWYKNDEPLTSRDGIFKQLGNCYLLIIENAAKCHAGKYMVNASNPGGEAQSIADFAVFDRTPNTMVEVHKTMVYENVADKDLKWEEKKKQLPSSGLTAEHVATTMIQPSSTLRTVVPPGPSALSSTTRNFEIVHPTVTTMKNRESESVLQKATRSEMIRSTIVSTQNEIKHDQKFHMKLQQRAPFRFDSDTPKLSDTAVIFTPSKISAEQTKNGGESLSMETTKTMDFRKTPGNIDEKLKENNKDLRTSTQAKRDAFAGSESIVKDNELTSDGSKTTMIQTSEDTDGVYDVKVAKSTKNYERETKFENSREVYLGCPSKKAIPEISKINEGPKTKLGGDEIMTDFAYDHHKLPKLNTHRALLQDTTASGSPVHGTLTISRLVAQSKSAEHMLSGFDLFPEPPPEIGYIPEAEKEPIRRISVQEELDQFQDPRIVTMNALVRDVIMSPTTAVGSQIRDSHTKTRAIGPSCIRRAVHIKDDDRRKDETKALNSTIDNENLSARLRFPIPDWDSRSQGLMNSSRYWSESSISGHFDSSIPAGGSVEKNECKQESTEVSRTSPIAQKNLMKSFTGEEKRKSPRIDYSSSTHENRSEVEEKYGGGLMKIDIESSTSSEARSWSTKVIRNDQTVIDELNTASLKPIIGSIEPSIVRKSIQTPKNSHKADIVREENVSDAIQEKENSRRYSPQCKVEGEDFIGTSIPEELTAFGLGEVFPISEECSNYAFKKEVGSEPLKLFQESSAIFKGTLATVPKYQIDSMNPNNDQDFRAAAASRTTLQRGSLRRSGHVLPVQAIEDGTQCIGGNPRRFPNREQNKLTSSSGEVYSSLSKGRAFPPIQPVHMRMTPTLIESKKLGVLDYSHSSSELILNPSEFQKWAGISNDNDSGFQADGFGLQGHDGGTQKSRFKESSTSTSKDDLSKPRESRIQSIFKTPTSELIEYPKLIGKSGNYSLETSSNEQTNIMTQNVKEIVEQYNHFGKHQRPRESMFLEPGSPPTYIWIGDRPGISQSKLNSVQQKSRNIGYINEILPKSGMDTISNQDPGDCGKFIWPRVMKERHMSEKRFHTSSMIQKHKDSTISSVHPPDTMTSRILRPQYEIQEKLLDEEGNLSIPPLFRTTERSRAQKIRE